MQQIVRESVRRDFAIPGSRRRLIGKVTVAGWYDADAAIGVSPMAGRLAGSGDSGQVREPEVLDPAIRQKL